MVTGGGYTESLCGVIMRGQALQLTALFLAVAGCKA